MEFFPCWGMLDLEVLYRKECVHVYDWKGGCMGSPPLLQGGLSLDELSQCSVLSLMGKDGQLPLLRSLAIRLLYCMACEPSLSRCMATVPAVQAKAKSEEIKLPWTIKYLYDGDCAMCLSLKTVLERQVGRERWDVLYDGDCAMCLRIGTYIPRYFVIVAAGLEGTGVGLSPPAPLGSRFLFCPCYPCCCCCSVAGGWRGLGAVLLPEKSTPHHQHPTLSNPQAVAVTQC
eukprot:1161216-Pelagomonas_calceolata.AAC.2